MELNAHSNGPFDQRTRKSSAAIRVSIHVDDRPSKREGLDRRPDSSRTHTALQHPAMKAIEVGVKQKDRGVSRCPYTLRLTLTPPWVTMSADHAQSSYSTSRAIRTFR